MELILFGNSISLFNLTVMTFLYIFTISVTLCGTITVDDIKSIISLSFLKDIMKKKEAIEEDNEEKEGFANIFKKCPCKKGKEKCKKFSQNKCIDDNLTHPLNSKNAYELEPGSYDIDNNAYSLFN
jgi:hypothetical protein